MDDANDEQIFVIDNFSIWHGMCHDIFADEILKSCTATTQKRVEIKFRPQLHDTGLPLEPYQILPFQGGFSN